MESPCLVRSATRADVPALVAIERVVFSDPWSSAGFDALLDGVSYVALVDDVPVGYLFSRLLADEAEILNLAVKDDHRRRGVGRCLIETAFRDFRTRRVRTVYLEVRASNTKGQSFYQNLGFTEVGRRRAYYQKPREDALILALDLEPAKRPA